MCVRFLRVTRRMAGHVVQRDMICTCPIITTNVPQCLAAIGQAISQFVAIKNFYCSDAFVVRGFRCDKFMAIAGRQTSIFLKHVRVPHVYLEKVLCDKSFQNKVAVSMALNIIQKPFYFKK